jgi:hypothetical protein
MHSAPAVRIEVGTDRAWQLATAGLGALTAAALAAWAAQWLAQAPDLVAAWAAVAAALGAVGGRRALALDRGLLQWDGAEWRWKSQPGAPHVLIDAGPWMLLRFDAEGGPRRPAWLALSRRAAGLQWHAWRAAVYSRRPEAPTDSAPRI